MQELIEKLIETRSLSKLEWIQLIDNRTPELAEYIFEQARETSKEYYGNSIYIRGLIEYTNYCKQNCYYCGIRCENRNVTRYRLSKEEILDCCEAGYDLGFRTFVLQGGEDPYFTDERMVDIVSAIRQTYDDCAITLSLGEKPYDSYQKLFDAGANRYLLRHETHNASHYSLLHPPSLRAKDRQRCLSYLKDIGYQVGTGFMVGSPFQTTEHLAEDMIFIRELNPQMVGIGPFIPHKDTPFAEYSAGTFGLTCYLLGLLRLMIPTLLLPSTTALGTIHPEGREYGILAGANVVMPNLSPLDVRKKYLLYNDKICTGDEAAEAVESLTKKMNNIGYQIVKARGDSKNI